MRQETLLNNHLHLWSHLFLQGPLPKETTIIRETRPPPSYRLSSPVSHSFWRFCASPAPISLNHRIPWWRRRSSQSSSTACHQPTIGQLWKGHLWCKDLALQGGCLDQCYNNLVIPAACNELALHPRLESPQQGTPWCRDFPVSRCSFQGSSRDLSLLEPTVRSSAEASPLTKEEALGHVWKTPYIQ